MEERNRGILRKSRSIFTRDLVDLDTVCDRLYQREVLSEGMKNEVLSEKTRENQVRKLLDIIPKRGKRAYGAFYDVLEETFQHNLSEILYPGGRKDLFENQERFPFQKSASATVESYREFERPPLMRSKSAESNMRREPVESISEDQEQSCVCVELPLQEKDFQKLSILDEEFALPEKWPSEPEHAQSLNFKVHRARSSSALSSLYVDSDVYPMTKKPRGRLVIINNFQFGTEVDTERMGRSQQDATSLDLLFKQLQFKTKQHSNLTLKELSAVLENERTRDHASLECYVMVVMSRGDGDRIYGVNGYKIDIDTIISMFDDEHCSSLRGIPKLFIFQACDDAKSKSFKELKKNSENLSSMVSSSTTSEHTVNMRADMFVVRATQDVAVSYHDVFGSRFIQSFVYLMRNLAFKEDLEEIVRKINLLNSVSEPEIVEFASSFTKKLYFNP